VPSDLRRRDLTPVVGEDACFAPVELRERDEVLLPDPRRRSRHDTAVELVHAGCRRSTSGHREIEAVPFAPWVRPQEQPALAGEAPREAARREQDRRLGIVRQRRLELDVTGRRDEESRQRARVVAAAGRERVLGVAPDRLRAERLEPAERVVEPLPDQPLQ
jgi:hypothetical protein